MIINLKKLDWVVRLLTKKKKMNKIKEIIDKENFTLEELINCFEIVKENGDIGFIKFDGEREKNEYTVFISFRNNKKDSIRAEDNNLKRALIRVLTKYIDEK